MPLVQPDINLVYRKSSTPTTNTTTAFKGSPLTNDELDNNFYGINVEMKTKAPINEAVFTGSTTIPNIIASGGTINGTVIGGTSPAAGTFTTVTTTGNLTVGDATGDILSIRAGTALLPALTTAGDLNTGMWFPAADTIAWSTNGAERLRIADAGLTIANDLTVTGDVAVNGGDLTTSSATFNLIDSGASTVNFARSGSAITIGSTSGTTTIRNNVSITGTGSVGGTLGVTGATTLSSTLGVTGATTLSSTLAVTGATTLNNSVTLVGNSVAATEYFRINDGTTTKFEVDSANGNTAISGTLGVTGAATLSSTLGVTGAATLSSTLGVTGAATLSSTLAVTGATTLNNNVTISGSTTAATEYFRITDGAGSPVTRFLVDSANGNTTISGTLGVTGATTLSSTLGVTGATTLSSTLGVTGATTLSSTLGVTGDVSVNTNKFTVTAVSGNTSIAGTLGVTGASTLSSTLGVTGATTLSSTLAVTGDVSVNTNRFTVAAASGNTLIAGTLGVTGAVTLSSTLGVTGVTTLSSTLGVTGATTLSSTLAVTGDVSVNTNKFTVTAASGNTVIAGTLGVTGASTIGTLNASSASFSGQVTSTVATGTAPFVVASTTRVLNLNADRVDDFTADQTNTASTIVVRDPSKNININNAVMSGATSGTTTLQPAAVSGTSVLTLPAATDTIVARATTDTLTNKTLNLTSNTLSGTLAQFNTALSDADFVSIAGVETLTNKTLTSPTINTATISGGTIDNAPIGGTTRAAGAFTTLSANSTLGVTGATTLSSTLGVTGATTLSSTLGVTGATTLSSTLAVTGATTLNNSVTVVGSTTAATELFRINDGTTTRFEVDSANGNTTISGTLGVTGNTTLGVLSSGSTSVSSLTSSGGVQGTVLTSTTAIGNAPLVVTSTTKVTNLNADRVNNFSLIPITTPGSTQTVAGSIPYVSSVTGANYDIGFSGSSSAGAVLVSGGGGAPSWIAPSGFSAGSSYASSHINTGNNGELLYQKSVTVNISTTNLSTTASVASVATSGIEVGQLVLNNVNVSGGTYVVSIDTVGNTITLSQAAVGTATSVSTKFLSTARLSLGSTNQVLTASSTAPAWSNSLSLSGSITHGGLSPSAGTNIDQVYTVTDSLTLNTTGWFDTSVNSTELTTGSYMVQVNTGFEYYTGVMSWYSPDINSAVTDEIILHRASSGTESGNLFLRVERTDNNASPDMTVQISSSVTRTVANYTFKFRRML